MHPLLLEKVSGVEDLIQDRRHSISSQTRLVD